MKTRDLLSLIAVAVLISALTACGKNAADETFAEPRTFASGPVAATEVPVTNPEEPRTFEAVTPETSAAETLIPEDDSAVPLHITVESICTGVFDPDTSTTKTNLRFFKLLLSDEGSKLLYPELSAAFDSYNRKAENDSIETQKELLSMYEETAVNRDNEYMAGMYMSEEKEGYVVRADSRVVSILSDCYTYYGGVHPDRYYSGINFDARTGARLMIRDVVNDQNKLFEIVDGKLRTEYADIYEYMNNVQDYVRDSTKDGNADIPFTLTSEGITVYFNTYCLGSYAMGPQFITVYFDEAPELFEKQYVRTAESYIIPVLEALPLDIDAGSGKREKISVESVPESDDEYAYNRWNVYCGSRCVTISDWCYYNNSYVIRSDGRYYLYLFETSDNDYSILAVIDLETMNYDPEKSGNYSLTLLNGSYESNDSSFVSVTREPAFTDTEAFRMSTRFDLLGTFSGTKTYYVGRKGLPETDDKMYELNSGMVYLTKRPIEVRLASEDGSAEADHTLPEGTYLHPIRSDGRTWMDVQEIDSSIVKGEINDEYSYLYIDGSDVPAADYSKPVYRIPVVKDGWPSTVGGIAEDECFYGISYAG